MSHSNEDKRFWCEAGGIQEVAFASPVRGGCVIMMNPAKDRDKYTHDYFMLIPADKKTIRTRFNTSLKYGISPVTAITLNKKDVDRYSELYPHIIILFDIDYGDYKCLRYATLKQVKAYINKGMAKLHTYIHRVGDSNGNAKESYVLNAEWFPELA